MKVCVIGAGTMGAGIAAHLANLNHDVLLLDRDTDTAQACFERATRVKPPHFYDRTSQARVTLGALEADLPTIAECDWVCEAIVEDLSAKRALYRLMLEHLRPDAIVSSNTSSLPLGQLSDGMPDHFRRRFLGTHFFNPPRFLKLLELIPTAETDPAEVARVTQILEREVGRRVVLAKDTPGFIANRFGMWAMFHAVHTAEKLGLTVEQVDAICGPFLGRPRSGAFRLNDLVGLDVMAFIAGIMHERCPDDPHRDVLLPPASLAFLLEKGWIGQKSGQGYYRREGKEFLSFDLNTKAYRNALPAEFASLSEVTKRPLGDRIRHALAQRDEAGEFLREHLVPVLRYAHYLGEEVSHTVEDFDRVMMWGFGWEMGPFAMMDAIGAEKLELPPAQFFSCGSQLGFDGRQIPIRVEPEYLLITDYPVVEERAGFRVRDLGEGVLGLALTTKMGVIDSALVTSLHEWLTSQDAPMVLCSEARSFSAGFDLKFFLSLAEEKDLDGIRGALEALQRLTELLTTKRIVAAVHGHCLGAGMELAMACSSILAHPEASLGLPEARVGLLPGGAGTCRVRLRQQSSLKDLVDALMRLVEGAVGSSAAEARGVGYLRPARDAIATHPDRLIHDARALALAADPQPIPTWKAMEGPLAGMVDAALSEAERSGQLTAHDVAIGQRIKAVFTRPTSLEDALVLERDEFVSLLESGLTLSRIRHMLETGKPLRN